MTPELDWLKRWALYAPEGIALQMGEDGRTLSYRELYCKSRLVAAVLRRRFHVQAGDRVACLAQNELESVVLFFAVQRLGAIFVPINFRFTASEVDHIVRDSGAKLLVVQAAYRGVVENLSVQLWDFDSLGSALGTDDREIEMEMQGGFEDPCMILYTSGTTGFPKGALLSNRMIFWNSINTGLRLNLTQNDVVLSFLPLFHTGGWNVLTTPCLHRGAKVILLRKFDADLILELCARERVTVLFGVPTMMDFMQRSPRFPITDLTSVRYAIVGGEPMPVPLIDVWEKRGVPIRQGYGLTEFGPNVFSLNEEDSRRKMGSIGFPNFYVEARVVDEQGGELPAGHVGELILRGPVAMSGYWRNPQATAEVLRDGWVHTGDLVRRDDEGYFFVVGRKKEMFISGGENVYPAEVEKVLRQVPGVREVAVIGVPHKKWGECGRAFVTAEAGTTLSPENLHGFCLQHLAKFKIPQQFVVLPDMPKTDSGKIAKQRLREWAEA